MLKLLLNGEAIAINHTLALATLLEQQGYQTQKIAVAINGEFIPRSLYTQTTISDDDEIDVIQAVGGG